jgi:hypothetical protein
MPLRFAPVVGGARELDTVVGLAGNGVPFDSDGLSEDDDSTAGAAGVDVGVEDGLDGTVAFGRVVSGLAGNFLSLSGDRCKTTVRVFAGLAAILVEADDMVVRVMMGGVLVMEKGGG